MIINKKLQEIKDKFAKSEAKLIADLKYDFITQVNLKRNALGLTFGDLAEKLKVSKPYMTKIMRGETNLTIESMVKLAKATGSKVSISVVDDSMIVFKSPWTGIHRPKHTAAPASPAGFESNILNSVNPQLSSNDREFQDLAA